MFSFNLLQIPSDRDLCVDVQFDREYYVGVVQAVPVNVYDYYEPGWTVILDYNVRNFTRNSLSNCNGFVEQLCCGKSRKTLCFF